jgi:hypothetical protein
VRYPRKRNLIRILPILLLTASWDVATAAEYVNPTLVSKEYPVRKVLLLPARVRLTRRGMKGKEGMARESDALAGKMDALVAKELRARNIDVLPNPFTAEALKNSDDLRATLTRLQTRYDTLAVQLHARPKDVRHGRYSLGDEVATLGPGAEADVIVFIRGIGEVVTRGKKAFSLAVAVAPVAGPDVDNIRTFLTFASSKNGDVLAVVDIVRSGLRARNFQEKTDEVIGKPLNNSLKKIPFSTK